MRRRTRVVPRSGDVVVDTQNDVQKQRRGSSSHYTTSSHLFILQFISNDPRVSLCDIVPQPLVGIGIEKYVQLMVDPSVNVGK